MKNYSPNCRLLLSLVILACLISSCSRVSKSYQQKSYTVNFLPEADIVIDGRLDEDAWQKAVKETHFINPWQKLSEPLTEFKAVYDSGNLYFSYVVEDADIVISKKSDDEKAVSEGDRVEIFFSCDSKLKSYYCLEIDPLARVMDYHVSYYRKFDYSWNCTGLRAAANITGNGYTVEIAVPLQTLKDLKLVSKDNSLIVGLYRAQFAMTSDRKIDWKWITWIDPHTKAPDFHVPASFGIFQLSPTK